jgi:hypothetical protein
MGKWAGSKLSAAIIGVLILISSAAILFAVLRRAPKETFLPPPPTVTPQMVNPWKEAARKAEEDRGEPTGRKAQVEVPAELKHYSDRRRFLAVQVAEWREQKYDVPHDFAELVALIRRDQLIEMEPFDKDYILYGVGAHASDEPFTHFDRASGEDIALFATYNDFQKEDEQLAASVKEIQARAAGLEKDLSKTGRRERDKRASITAQLKEARKLLKSAEEKRKLLASFYKEPKRRDFILSEYKALAEFAANFSGKAYDLTVPADRKQLKVRLLSFVRPEAKEAILEIARLYSDKFDRPLPITSLVRTERYQQELSESNPNATRINVPPHTTGLAFDIYYRYMTGEEQDFLMSEIARLKAAGRLEALRETRDHIHVFAFPDGEPPAESLIAQAAGQLGPSRGAKQASPKRASARSKSKGARVAKSKKSSKSTKATRASKARSKSRYGVRADRGGRK